MLVVNYFLFVVWYIYRSYYRQGVFLCLDVISSVFHWGSSSAYEKRGYNPTRYTVWRTPNDGCTGGHGDTVFSVGKNKVNHPPDNLYSVTLVYISGSFYHWWVSVQTIELPTCVYWWYKFSCKRIRWLHGDCFIYFRKSILGGFHERYYV